MLNYHFCHGKDTTMLRNSTGVEIYKLANLFFL